MDKISTILLNPVKKTEEVKDDSNFFLENLINESKELKLVKKLLSKDLFSPSEKVIEKIFQKCDIRLSH
jgi:hypothetical protein